LLQPHLVRVVVSRHVGQNNAVAFFESVEDLYLRDGRSADFDLNAGGGCAAGVDAEQADGRVFVSERRTADIEHIVQAFQVDGSVNAQLWDRARRQRSIQ